MISIFSDSIKENPAPGAYLDIANALSNGRCYQHGCGGDNASGEEDGSEFTLRQGELALKKVSHP
jgi:hypothetical protein